MLCLGRLSWGLLAVAICALIAACGASGPAEPARQPSAATLTVEASQASLAPPGPSLGSQHSGDLWLWLASRPVQPVEGTAEMDAYLVSAGGQAITDARVTFDTDMTNMSHGLYLVSAQPAGNGHYQGRVHFSMPGPWRIITIVDRPGQMPVKLRIEFRVKAQ